jgi:hypothetical protein
MPMLPFTRHITVFLSLSILAYIQTVLLFVVINVCAIEQTGVWECSRMQRTKENTLSVFPLSLSPPSNCFL